MNTPVKTSTQIGISYLRWAPISYAYPKNDFIIYIFNYFLMFTIEVFIDSFIGFKKIDWNSQIKYQNFMFWRSLTIYLKEGLFDGSRSQHLFINFTYCSGVFFGIGGLISLFSTYMETCSPVKSKSKQIYVWREAIWKQFPKVLYHN